MFDDGLAAMLPDTPRGRRPARAGTAAPDVLRPTAACVNTLGQALDICDRVRRRRLGIGVAVDVYHVWWDPDLCAADRPRGAASPAFHVCDWLVPTRDLLLDRGMMGDGVIEIPGIRAMAEAAGYAGPVEVEILSRRWWAEDPDAVLRLVRERHATAC